MGLLPKGCPSNKRKRTSLELPALGSPVQRGTHFGFSQGTLLGPIFPRCEVEIVFICGAAILSDCGKAQH